VAIREIVAGLKPPTVGNVVPELTCQIGIATGPTFAAEIGEMRGRREFNVLGDTVNTAARLMNRAAKGQILVTGRVHEAIESSFEWESLGSASLKGKAAPIPIYSLLGPREG
jgi:class 3 adenylate cyclase